MEGRSFPPGMQLSPCKNTTVTRTTNTLLQPPHCLLGALYCACTANGRGRWAAKKRNPPYLPARSGPENNPPFLSRFCLVPEVSIKTHLNSAPSHVHHRRPTGIPVSHTHTQRVVGEEDGPKSNAAAAAAVLCGSPGPRERRGGTAPSSLPPNLFPRINVIDVVGPSNRRLASSPPSSPSSSSSCSPSRRATSFLGGPKSLGVLLPWRGKGIYRCCWGVGC
jgi:hypothetical protein